MFNSSSIVALAGNVSRLGEVGELKAQSLKLLLMLIKSTNDE
jgi:hypothetical protein